MPLYKMPCNGLDEPCSGSNGVTAVERNAIRTDPMEKTGTLPAEAELLCTPCKFEMKILN